MSAQAAPIVNKLPPDVRRSVIGLALGGAILLLAVGFIPLDEIHSVTHDTRHLIGFPCH